MLYCIGEAVKLETWTVFQVFSLAQLLVFEAKRFKSGYFLFINYHGDILVLWILKRVQLYLK